MQKKTWPDAHKGVFGGFCIGKVAEKPSIEGGTGRQSVNLRWERGKTGQESGAENEH